jgi:quercetin dioxygenase-like cupin family protein
MYLASRKDPAKSSFSEAIGGGDIAARWLIDDERGGAQRGKVGLIEIGSGSAATLASEPNYERLLFVLDGHGSVRADNVSTDLRNGSVVFVPSGSAAEVQARDDGLQLLLIQGSIAAERVAGPSNTELLITHLEKVENVPFHRPELGFLRVAARWLVDAKSAKARSLVVGQSTFVPGAAHLLHKHHHGDEFFYVFEGRGCHLIEGREIPMQPGDVVFAPREEWHGFRNTGDQPVRAIFGYFGVSSLEDAGYEVHEQGKRPSE